MTLKRILILILVLFVVSTSLMLAYFFMPVVVRVKIHTISGTDTMLVSTRVGDVKGLMGELDEKNKLQKDYILDTDESRAVTRGLKVDIRQATEMSVPIAGEKKNLLLYPGTVEENLAINEVTYDSDDIITPALNEEVTDKTKLEVKEVHHKSFDKTKKVKPKDKAMFDTGISSGTVVVEEGEDGKGVYHYEQTFINGKKTDETKKFVKWEKKPKDRTLRFGTSATGETGEVSYSRTFTGNCTAYYMGKSPVGASGGRCHYGTCAVDPSVIPYGTKLYVEGYGVAVANDTGGAVKGNVVDLYMHSTKEAIQWGRRYKTVYVLE